MRKRMNCCALTLKDAVGVGLGAIIGAGIFVVTGVAAGCRGLPSSWD